MSDLDLRMVLKTSQAISGELELDKLLVKMMHIIIENAGAQIGFLILARGEEWIIQGIAEVDKNKVQVLQSMDIEKNDTVSSGIIHYVARTRETVVLEDAAHEGDFISDRTIQRRKSRSVLCMPLINQGRISGILYLENNLTTDAFTPGHVELLKLLSSVMAMALNKSQVYHDLKKSEKRFRTTFEQAAVGIAHVGTDGRFLRINEKFCGIVGYTHEEMLTRTFQDITHPDDLDIDLEFVRQVLKGKIENYSLQKRYYRKDGSIIWVHLTVSLVFDKGNEPDYFVSVVKDISDRKQVEEALRQSRDFLEHLITAMPDAVFSIKIPGRTINWANDSFDVMGYTNEEYVGRSVEEFYAYPEDYEKVGRIQKEAIQRGDNKISTEIMVRHKDGKAFPAQLIGTFLKEQGELSQITATVRDISRPKMVEEQVLNYQQRLKDLANELTITEEKVRKQIARDLHDHVGQMLHLSEDTHLPPFVCSFQTFTKLKRFRKLLQRSNPFRWH